MTFKRSGLVPALFLVALMLAVWISWVNRQVALPEATGARLHHGQVDGGTGCPYKSEQRNSRIREDF